MANNTMMKSSGLANLMAAVSSFHAKVGDPRLQTSTLLAFLHIAMRGEVAQAELQDVMMVEGKSTVTRALQTLGRGQVERDGTSARLVPGLGWVETHEDPLYAKQKLVRLTPAGREVARSLERAASKYPTT